MEVDFPSAMEGDDYDDDEVDDNNNNNSSNNNATASNVVSSANHTPMERRSSMTEDEQKERRASIRAIMTDNSLTPMERRKSIQSLMDGRRRSSTASVGSTSGGIPLPGSMAAAAAAAAAAFDGSSSASEFGDDDDDDDDDLHHYSTTSSITSGEEMSSAGNTASSHPRQGRRNSLRDSLANSFSNLMSTFSRRDSLTSLASETADSGMTTTDPHPTSICSTATTTTNTTAATTAMIAASRRMELTRPNCPHYDRKCTIVSPCCGLAFGCRICHDDCPVLPPPIFLQQQQQQQQQKEQQQKAEEKKKKDDDFDEPPPKRRHSLPTAFQEEETHHNIDRFAIKEIICRECFTRQSSKTNQCINCGIEFGEYHCSKCNLWMSAEEEPYHCDDCGFCRVGGRENFIHCNDCGMCIDALLFDEHNCKSGKYMSNCPVCQEDLFSSRSASHEMPCGHAIHWHCFRELTAFDTRCPVCKKTAETPEQMAPTWSAMAMAIALQPVPPELARVVNISCNDCEEKDSNRRWHFLGVQCMECTSFNTTVESTPFMGHEAAAFLGDDLNNPTNTNATTATTASAATITNNGISSGGGGISAGMGDLMSTTTLGDQASMAAVLSSGTRDPSSSPSSDFVRNPYGNDFPMNTNDDDDVPGTDNTSHTQDSE